MCAFTGHPGGLIQDIWVCARRSEVAAHRSQRGRNGTGSILPRLQPSVVENPADSHILRLKLVSRAEDSWASHTEMIKQETKTCLSAHNAWDMARLPEPVRAAGALREKLLTARLWPRCFRLHAVRHLESMLCLIRYQSDSVMPNLWNRWPIQDKKTHSHL